MKTKATERKAELQAAKVKGGDSWNDELRDELKELVDFLAEADKVLAEKEADYEPAPGTEDMVHLVICKGNRFSASTGKRISEDYVQLFTRSEWNAFRNSFSLLGYSIVKILHDPTNEAAAYVKPVTEKE